jgi:protein phosphatase 1L
MLHTARFLCSVAAAVAHLLRELRKVLIRASAFSPVAVASPPTTAAAAASPAVGVISAMTLPLRRKTPAAAASAVAIQKQLLVVAPAPPSAAVIVGAEVPNVVGGCCGDDVAQQQAESKKKKTAWDARRRPTRLLIPVADDVGEVAAGWAAAAAAQAREADLDEVEGEGFRLASRAGPRHAMEDAYAVVTHKHDGDSELVINFSCVANYLINCLLDFY